MDFVADFKALESNQPQKVEEAKQNFHEYLNSTKDPWVMNGLLDYYFTTGSLRVVEIVIGIREPQDRCLFDRLSEALRGGCKLQTLTLLGLIARRSPTWLYKISNHSLLKDLLRLLKVETDMVLVMSALLLLIILLPMIAGLVGPSLQEIFEIFSRLAAWNTNNPNKMSASQMLHLQVGLYALFHRLYGMFPCNFLSFLRKEYSQKENFTAFKHTIRPLLDSHKMHPFLIISGKEDETTSRRWVEKAPHDIIVECATFAVETPEKGKELTDDLPTVVSGNPPASSRSPLESSGVLDGCYTSRGIRGFSSQLQRTIVKENFWSPQSLCGMVSPHEPSAPTSIPLTPISQAYSSGAAMPQPEGTSPPEAAVEATPETTPIKDTRHPGRGPPPIGSSVVRALNTSLGPGHSSPVSSQPSSPMRKDALPYRFPTENISAFQQPIKNSSEPKKESAFITQKMQKVFMERNQLNEFREAKSQKSKPATPAQPVSPLRLINPVQAWQSGHDLTLAADDAQVDKEVEAVLKGDKRRKEEEEEKVQGAEQSHGGEEHCSRESGSLSAQMSVARQEEDAGSTVMNGHATVQELPSAGRRVRTVSASVQTDSPQPYEHLFAAALPSIPVQSQECCSHSRHSQASLYSPHNAVEASLAAASKLHDLTVTDKDLKSGKDVSIEYDVRRWKEHLGLVNLQLQFERHRREVHAERNRRLLGASRVNRSIEEHNLALKDQVALLQNDTDLVAAEMLRYQKESRLHSDTLRQSDGFWRDTANQVEASYKLLNATCHNMQQHLKQEREKTATLTKALDETKATLYNTTHELQLALSMLNSTREARSELSTVQRELMTQGETQLKVRETLANVARSTNRAAELSMLKETFSHQVKGLSEQLELQKCANEALAARVMELEASLAEKDKLCVKQKTCLEEANLKHSDQCKSLESKCSELSTALMSLQEKELEYQSKVEELRQQVKRLAGGGGGGGDGVGEGGHSNNLTRLGSNSEHTLLGRASSLDPGAPQRSALLPDRPDTPPADGTK